MVNMLICTFCIHLADSLHYQTTGESKSFCVKKKKKLSHILSEYNSETDCIHDIMLFCLSVVSIHVSLSCAQHTLRSLNTLKISCSSSDKRRHNGWWPDTVRIAQLVEDQTLDRKVVGLIPGRSSGRIFFSRVLCLLLFNVHSFAMSLQWHVKDPCHFTKSVGGKL